VPAVQASTWNLANALTGLRLLLVPVLWLMLMHEGGESSQWRIAAFAVFALASITDRVDGEVARRWGQVTDLGKIADPIADKALIGAALIGLSVLGEVSWWVTIVVLAREAAVTVLRFVVIRHGVMAASRGGKAKTFVQAVAIGLYILPLGSPFDLVAAAVMGMAVVITVATGVDYVVRAVRLRRTSDLTARRRAERAKPAGS
jgi:CDP-diacylglycerol--glycerol-3-phosphate 3-phosphatidyltransferase